MTGSRRNGAASYKKALKRYSFSEVLKAQEPPGEMKDYERYHTHMVPTVIYAMKFVEVPYVKVLDIGCRDAQIAKLFPSPNYYVGIDFVKRAVKYAKEKGRRALVGDAMFLPFLSDTFDLVILRHVIEHTLYPPQTFMEAVRVAKEGAILALVVPKEEQGKPLPPAHYHELKERDVQKLILPVGKLLSSSIQEAERRFIMAITKETAGSVLGVEPDPTPKPPATPTPPKAPYKEEEPILNLPAGTTAEPATAATEQPPKSKETTALAWDKKDVAVAAHAKTLKNMDKDSTGVPGFLQFLDPKIRDKRVIDFGCGPGVYAVRLFGSYGYYLGLDGSAAAVDIAKSYAANYANKCAFAVLRLDAPFDIKEKFDIGIVCDVIRHLDPQTVSASLKNMLSNVPEIVIFDCYGVSTPSHKDKESALFGVHCDQAVYNIMRTVPEAEAFFNEFGTITGKQEIVRFSSGNNSYVKYVHVISGRVIDLRDEN